MKVRISREEILKTMKVPVNGADGAIVVLPDFLELEATPLENDNIISLRLCKSFEDHKNNKASGIECDCFKLKPCTQPNQCEHIFAHTLVKDGKTYSSPCAKCGYVIDRFEATPVEREEPKELKRLTNYYTIQHTDHLNQELDQIYQALNELRKK